jgi:hypothetical protein
MSWLRRLLQPLSKPQESVCNAQLIPTNWASSQPHLALLEKFLSAHDAKKCVPDFWASAFGMSPQLVIDGLVAHGALEHVPLPDKIEICHTVAELRKILSSRGLKVSGKKADLIRRLLEADPIGIKKLYAHRMVLRCVPAASLAVSRWKAECATAFETATDDVIAALHNRDFNAAIRVSDVYRKSKFEPPLDPRVEAMSIKPAPRSIKERANELAAVFAMRLKSMEGLQPEQREGHYLNYAVWQLLGRIVPKIDGVTQDGAAHITLSLYFKAREQINRDRQTSLGITHAIWICSKLPCMKDPRHPTAAEVQQDSAHRSANGKKYEIAKGLLLDGKWTWPGYEEECSCMSKSVLPWSEE